MVTTEMAEAGSTVVEGMAVVAATVVGEEAISRRTTPNRYALKRFAEVSTSFKSRIHLRANSEDKKLTS